MPASTMIVYSIFYLVGNSSVQYLPDSVTAARYENLKQCNAALKDLRINLSASLSNDEANTSITPQDRTKLDDAYRRAQSMSCQEIEIDLPSPVQQAKATAVPANAKALVLWKIGRIDQANIFHGTAYNEYAFDDEQTCKEAYFTTQASVFDRAISEGGNNVQAAEMLNTFISTYKCAQVALKAGEINRQPVSTQAVAQLINVPEQGPIRTIAAQPVVQPQYMQQPMEQPTLVPQYQQSPQPVYSQRVRQQGYAPSAFLSASYPVRPVYIAETVQSPWGSMSQFLYPTPYSTVAECWGAVNQMFGTQPTERRNSAQCVFAAR